jgi:excisionase family DNA binding protein
MPETTERLALTPSETAKALGLSRTKLYELLRSGELPSRRIGRVLRVPKSAITRWLESQGADDAR